MPIDIKLIINGKSHALAVEPTDTLLNVPRGHLGLTGTNRDCAMGICDVCTVLVDGKTTSSCILLAVQADGCDIVTIEGIEQDGRLSKLQEAFLRHGAVQCGYCTLGFIITATALLEEKTHPTRDEITDALRGNLCRCTGYKKIIEAVEEVASVEV